MEEKLKIIADHYGYKEQQWKLVEEMAEVAKEINKFRKKNYNKNTNAYKKLVSELADLSVVLPQVIYLLECEDKVARIRREKAHRQLKRMENEHVRKEKGCD
ncbi:MAG TPA: hypothetical protein IAC41_09255 [Candidatus Merdenecus merdavium]|nr:hypothetical protein [Candidatus Merdenecus merdavium]